MALEILPSEATLSGGDAVAFRVVSGDAAAAVESWELSGGGTLKDGVFTAPRVVLVGGRSVVTARTAAGSVSAEVITSPAHNWIPILSVYFAVVVGACAWGVIGLWQSDFSKSPAGWLLLRVSALCGALGACLHGINSLAAYVGAKQFQSSWSLYYVARPVVGGILGPMIFLVFRSNLVGDAQQVNTNDWLTVAALTAISGLFADKAVEKLKQVVDVLFSVPRDARPDKLGKDEKASSGASGEQAGGAAGAETAASGADKGPEPVAEGEAGAATEEVKKRGAAA